MGDGPFRVGDGVVYRAHLGADPEDGVVTALSTDPSLVFVRYAGQHPGAGGKATRVIDLEPLHRVRERRQAVLGDLCDCPAASARHYWNPTVCPPDVALDAQEQEAPRG